MARHERNGRSRRSASTDGSTDSSDPTLDALQDLLRAAEQMRAAATLVMDRAAQIRASREEGLPYRAIVGTGNRPLIAELLTRTIASFEAAGTCFRRAQARALHDEGMTMEEIAQLYGLTRQRISALLREPPPARTGHFSRMSPDPGSRTPD